MLELGDGTIFLASGLTPYSGHWCHVCQITKATFNGRIRLEVMDMHPDMDQYVGPLVVGFLLPDAQTARIQEFWRQLQAGTHHLPLGRPVIRVSRWEEGVRSGGHHDRQGTVRYERLRLVRRLRMLHIDANDTDHTRVSEAPPVRDIHSYAA